MFVEYKPALSILQKFSKKSNPQKGYECVKNAKFVKINHEKLQSFVDTIEQEKKQNQKIIEDVSQPWKLPVNYSSVAEGFIDSSSILSK